VTTVVDPLGTASIIYHRAGAAIADVSAAVPQAAYPTAPADAPRIFTTEARRSRCVRSIRRRSNSSRRSQRASDYSVPILADGTDFAGRRCDRPTPHECAIDGPAV
jgi:hypothetical protein